MAKKSRFFRRHRKKWSKIKKYFGFFLVSYISIQKKKCTSEQFLQGRPRRAPTLSGAWGGRAPGRPP